MQAICTIMHWVIDHNQGELGEELESSGSLL